MKYIKYFWTVCRHKWYVFVECCKLGIPLLGIIHDWSKFLPSEFFPYAEYFNGGYERGKQPEHVKLAFDFAWLHHQRWNKHHWQSYVLHNDNPECLKWHLITYHWGSHGWKADIRVDLPDNIYEHIHLTSISNAEWTISNLVREMSRLPKALPIPDRYRREMVADWRGAGKAYGNDDTAGWYLKNCHNIILHPETRRWVELELGVLVKHES